MEKHIFLLTLLFLVQFFISIASSNDTDQEALLSFQNLITSPNHFFANNWTKNTSLCSWFGVTCSSKTQRVVALALPNLQLQGTISPSLANLSFLRELNLENNLFHGGVPYRLGHLPRLRVINVRNNQLEGSIPTSLFQHQRVQFISLAYNKLIGEMWKGPWYVPELRVLSLRNNSLTGIIPSSVGNATKLLNFSLSGNRINGIIPTEIGNLSQLIELHLFNNQLAGSIPATLFNISSLIRASLASNSLSGPLLLDEGNNVSNLKYLSISKNQISGCIPSNICQLTELKILSISYNNMIGNIPRNIGCLSKIEEFYIGNNPITGTIPTSLGNISTLRNLYCGNSRIVGQIPKDIFNLSSLEMIDCSYSNLSGRIPTTSGLHVQNLKELFLGHNELEGEIPLFITNASKLEILGLENNFLTGTIPTNLGNLRELQELFLHDNQLTNEPREHELQFFNSLADCRMLRYLQVGFNPLNGVLPDSIGNLSSTIENFHIADAHINGPIPRGLLNMSGLIALSLGENNLAGSIPSDVVKLEQLQGLYLNNNKLQGHIPEAVCHLSNLVQLSLGGNELFGLIPECLGNLRMLQAIILSSNKFSSKIPLSIWKMSGLLYLIMSQNSIEGEVPQDIGGLKAIVGLDLSGNHFSGMIPSQLGDLQNMNTLDLSNNSFSGSTPLSFANLISLEYLDLSLNVLSGTIPKSLEKLLYLKSINVSFNDLEGVIPSGGVFANSTLQSFIGNKGLCGMHIMEIPACAITTTGQQSKSKKLVLKIVIPVIAASFLIFLFAIVWIMKRQKKANSKDVEKVPEIRTYQLVSYHEIQQATNNFDGSNLIGVGGSGSVYKGTLSSGTVVAIKVLDLQNEEVCKRFDAECEVMRNVRHRNLIPVITTCSSEYVRAFVLQYMPNGSLERWLYIEDRHLNLLQRVTIMLDVAQAIEYLHHGHKTLIVHCDLKPTNVLLDEEMVAHVGDFGISKILAASKSMAHTETLGTLGYIAPEYGLEGRVSSSGDVYSYGIMMIEVLTKRRPTDDEIFNENLGLRQWIRQSFPKTIMEVVDVNFIHEEEHFNSKSEICIGSMMELALDCTKEMPESRITMRDVVKRLDKIKNTFLGT
ncbi:probable LRR receptor-like serine/threonine-protein kinase At3g47570 [Solanum stenotomum]|uniref:probable LRR receptor-like serine/threonine-protein kinase At3g47570 n=1 Tax=Solanum stenotomum TaxID=172797 RepID=UPI0020D18B06|nr:probable LRR receptor-like serine/threonine-protein kinase At3g47570 [Solanum stenotomum]